MNVRQQFGICFWILGLGLSMTLDRNSHGQYFTGAISGFGMGLLSLG